MYSPSQKIDGVRVRFLSVATAPSRPRPDGANAQSVYLFEKKCNLFPTFLREQDCKDGMKEGNGACHVSTIGPLK
ncbi:hypothetical protein Y032_0012g1886 [Ancylostoma ceylanicum]|nr:hypothetical protein Y032_0012g1886 [Ancylostoma ceylanicum]